MAVSSKIPEPALSIKYVRVSVSPDLAFSSWADQVLSTIELDWIGNSESRVLDVDTKEYGTMSLFLEWVVLEKGALLRESGPFGERGPFRERELTKYVR